MRNLVDFGRKLLFKIFLNRNSNMSFEKNIGGYKGEDLPEFFDIKIRIEEIWKIGKNIKNLIWIREFLPIEHSHRLVTLISWNMASLFEMSLFFLLFYVRKSLNYFLD